MAVEPNADMRLHLLYLLQQQQYVDDFNDRTADRSIHSSTDRSICVNYSYIENFIVDFLGAR